jgi:hypothetical protein
MCIKIKRVNLSLFHWYKLQQIWRKLMKSYILYILYILYIFKKGIFNKHMFERRL